MAKWQGYMHGVNLGGWLSQCDHTKERYETFIKESDIAVIKEWGLDHIRLPIDYDLVEDDEGNYKEDGFTYIDRAVEWCGKYGLNLLLDLHKTFGYSFDAGEKEEGFFDREDYQERFYRLWEEFAKRYGKYEDRLSFELLNEVTDRSYCEKWNEISTTCIRRIRKIAPTIHILIGGYHYNSVEAIPDLAMPVDENVIYNFHCYDPTVFTHQGAYWIETMDRDFRISKDATYAELQAAHEANVPGHFKGAGHFPADGHLDENYFLWFFEQAAKVAKERGTSLYCGEYGVIDLADPEDALAWYKMISAAFEQYGIGRAAWSYKEMDFGLADAHMDSVREEVLKLL